MKTLWIDAGVSGRVNETAGDSSPPPPSLDRLEPFEREQLRLLDEVMVWERACLRIVEFYIDLLGVAFSSSSSSTSLHIFYST